MHYLNYLAESCCQHFSDIYSRKNILKYGRIHYEKLSQFILFPFLACPFHLVIVTWFSAMTIK